MNTTIFYELCNVDGEIIPISLDEFFKANSDIDPETEARIRAIEPGEIYTDGGGAQPEWSIRCVDPNEVTAKYGEDGEDFSVPGDDDVCTEAAYEEELYG